MRRCFREEDGDGLIKFKFWSVWFELSPKTRFESVKERLALLYFWVYYDQSNFIILIL